MKKCNKCNLSKSLEEFHRMSRTPDGRRYTCKACRKQFNKDPKNQKKKKDGDLKRNYGISLEEYNNMLKIQENKCAICKNIENKKLVVDHCHKTGKVRKLLCHKCNTSLGLLKESIKTLYNMITYIEDNNNNTTSE